MCHVFKMTEHQLFNIPRFVEEVQRENSAVREAGVFKVVLSEDIQGQGTPLDDIINLAKPKLKDARKQYLLAIKHCSDLYGYRSYEHDAEAESNIPSICTSGDVQKFINLVTDLKSYELDTCCSRAVSEGEDAVVHHFFSDVVPKQAIQTTSCSKLKSIEAVKRKGKRDSKNIEEFMASLNSRSTEERLALIEKSISTDLRGIRESCECLECYNDNVNVKKGSKNFSKGVMYGQGIELHPHDHIKMTSNFGLYCLASTSLLRLLDHHYPGITWPYLYFGTEHSFFPAHIEDFSLYSWNYLHYGQPKVWIVVSPLSVLRLHNLIALQCPNVYHSTCHNLLGHKYFMPTTKWLADRQIAFKVIIQHPGESIILCPNAVHWGFNTGCNVAQACNFGTQSWIPYGIVAPKCRCTGFEVHMDLERIIGASRPDLLQCYRKQTIPEGEDTYFYNSILKGGGIVNLPQTATKQTIEHCSTSFMSESDGLEQGHPAQSDSAEAIKHSDTGETEDEPVFPKITSRPKGRKQIICPKTTCSQKYAHGHKDKLYKHIKNFHKNDTDYAQLKIDFKNLFTVRPQGPKKACNICGKLMGGRASQMSKHQRSSGCIRNNTQEGNG